MKTVKPRATRSQPVNAVSVKPSGVTSAANPATVPASTSSHPADDMTGGLSR